LDKGKKKYTEVRIDTIKFEELRVTIGYTTKRKTYLEDEKSNLRSELDKCKKFVIMIINFSDSTVALLKIILDEYRDKIYCGREPFDNGITFKFNEMQFPK
jgi:hypothetical protein